MSTPLDSLPGYNFANLPPEPQPVVAVIDPDNPPWGLGAAAFTWLSSVALLLASAFLALIIYFLTSGVRSLAEVRPDVQNDPRFVVLTLSLMIPAHIATLVVVWAVVTGFGKRPFWRTVGWSWSPRLGLKWSIVLGNLLFILGAALVYFLGRDVQTPLDEMIESSTQARFLTTFLALAGAPIVEELVYRGVLYPALQRAVGALWAVPLVAGLFTLIHYEQYYTNPAVLVAVGSLSLALTFVRARTGRLLPCFVIHLVFNGVQCVLIIIEYFARLPSGDETKTGFAVLGAHFLAPIFPVL